MKKNAFSLIELILAIFILTVAVFGSFALIQRIAVFAYASQNKLTAYYLAQEGIENVRNIRDNNWLQSKENWTDGLPINIEVAEPNLLGMFTRKTLVKIDETEKNLLKVTVTVSWQEHGRQSQVQVMTNLYNWYALSQ